MSINVQELLEQEARYCSFGDTVHYVNPPKIFTGCDGSYMFDNDGTAFLDLQMWYSAVNFGYKNKRLDETLIRQIHELPQVAQPVSAPDKDRTGQVHRRGRAEEVGPAGPGSISTSAGPRPSTIL